MKRSHFNIITGIIAIVYISILVLGNVFYRGVPIATIPGSYANKFADEKMLKQVEIPDSMRKFLNLKYETFEYNTTNKDTLSLEKYNGISRELVIPGFINGVMVTAIGSDFFKESKVDSIYLPETIVEINAEPDNEVTIYCDKDSSFYEFNKENKNWNIETVYDSTYINPLCADIPYAYNDNGSSIELVEYLGDEKIIAIPSYIDGKPVTTVSFDLLGNYEMVIFPDTVTAINGKVSTWIYSSVFAVEIIFSVLALVIVFIAVNVILPRYRKDNNEYMLSGTQIIFSLMYLIAQLCVCVKFVYFSLAPTIIAFIVSFVMMIIYLVLMSLVGAGRKHVNNVNEKIAVQTAPIRNLQSLVRGLGDEIKDPEVKKYVNRVVDEIRYSPARSTNATVEKDLEYLINELKDVIESDNKEDIIDKCEEILKLCKKR